MKNPETDGTYVEETMKEPKEPWVVEASYEDERMPAKLKRLVRKPVSFSGGGGKWQRDIGWSYVSKRGAFAAASRLRRCGRVHVEVYDLRSRP
jgi:hypothetical protein